MDHLMTVVHKALEFGALREENRALRQQLGGRYDFANVIAVSPPMREVLDTVKRVAANRATVLLQGESGVGKDLIARAIHYQSSRRAAPFVKISCTAIPENLMESELFGYEKGAFTGALVSKPGRFADADTGTVFLDEIGDVPLSIQVKLLRVIQEREFEPLGSNKTRLIDVRVIAATNTDLRQAIQQGRFREDLYYRLNVVPILIPPLRQRREDIPSLAERFVKKFSGEFGSAVSAISKSAMDVLVNYTWPGNVRQLENVLERSILLCERSVLEAQDVRLDSSPPPSISPSDVPFVPDGMTLDQFEQAILREALRRAAGNKSQAARLLGLTRNALRYRLTQMGIES
jgi:transcriptional regulator with PAS, ATPase and Fis domain